ncbi:MAG TPA: hypothetical protein VJM15_02155 [Sphingomicrobium sp.]|nr:hypothetical protein [Sphingomicrobium sp.]
MTGPAAAGPAMPVAPASAAETAELERYGIVRQPTDVFLWNGYRYTQARDALAAAKRAASE